MNNKKSKLFSHPRWNDIPIFHVVEDPKNMTDDLKKQREIDNKMIEEFSKKLNLPSRIKNK